MSRLLELAQEAEQSANLGNAVDVKLMMQNYAQLIIQECSIAMIETDNYYGEWMTNVITNRFEMSSIIQYAPDTTYVLVRNRNIVEIKLTEKFDSSGYKFLDFSKNKSPDGTEMEEWVSEEYHNEIMRVKE